MDPVIKKQDVDDSLAAGKFNFNSFERDAQRIIDGARQEAQAQIYKAQQEINKMRAEIRGEEFGQARKQGYDQGFEEGKKEGLEAGRKEAYEQHLKELTEATQGVQTMLEGLLKEVSERRESMVEEAERDMLSLSFAIAERLTRLRIETDPTVVRETLRNALDLVLNRSSLDIFVCDADLEAISEHLPALRRQFGDIGDVRLHAEKDVPRGSVEVRTARGRVSIDITEQLNRIAAELLGVDADKALENAGANGMGSDKPQVLSGASPHPLSNTRPVSIDELSAKKRAVDTQQILRESLGDPEEAYRGPTDIDEVVKNKESADRLTRLIEHAEVHNTDYIAKQAMADAETTSSELVNKFTSHSDVNKRATGEIQEDDQDAGVIAESDEDPSGDAASDDKTDAAEASMSADADLAPAEEPRSFDVNQGSGSSSLDSLLSDIEQAADDEEQHRAED